MADKRVIEQTASTEIYSDDWFLKDSVLEGTSKISGVNLKELLGADGTQALEEIANAIAEEYDSTQTYTYNSWVFHEGVLYRCITQSVTGTWDATKWQAKTIKEFIDTAKNSVLSTIEQMLGEYLPISTLDPPSIEAISKGDIFIYQRTNRYKFYRAKADHPQGVTEFDIDDWDEFDTVADLIEDVTENAGKVADVQVKTTDDYESVVENKIAKIDLSSMTAYGEVPNLPQAIASFSDGADAPMKSLKVAIEPQQDLHGYDAPWVGGAGKNKYDGETKKGYIYNGTYYSSDDYWCNKNDIPVKENTTYIFSGVVSNGQICCYDANKQFTGDVFAPNTSFTTPSGVAYISIYNPISTESNNKQLEEGSTITSYAPYSNICPISGWSEVNVTRCGKNWFDKTTVTVKKFLTSDGRIETSANWSISDYIGVKGGTAYILSGVTNAGTVAYHCFYDKDKNFISSVISTTQNFTTPSNAVYVRLSMRTETPDAVQLELGNTATEYHAYNGQTYTIDLDGTRYGGELDVVNGIVTPAPYYASYNGETLTGEWISDRDKYEVGATPTIGAQVVNIGASGTPVSILPTAVKSLLGQNNIWADTGDINDCIYRRDMSSTIDDILARLEALEG